MKSLLSPLGMRHAWVLPCALFLPGLGYAQDLSAAMPVDLQHHWLGYLTIAVTLIAYAAAMTEDLHQMSKAKPMIFGAMLIWCVIFVHAAVAYGSPKSVMPVFHANLEAYAELFLFITVSMTFLNAMTERGLFDALRIELANRRYSYRQLFWITGILAFLLSLVISSLTVGLLMGYIILGIGKGQPKFVGLAGLNAHEQTAYFPDEYERQIHLEWRKGFDVFKCVAGVDWDTLLFFYGAMMIVGALSHVGYLDAMAHYLFTEISPTLANILIGLSSSSIDNGTLMYAVLNMHPPFPLGQWLLLTLTLGVGGSLLAIGSAPGLNVLGLMKGKLPEGQGYTFALHLRWMPAILLGFFASIATLFLLHGGEL